MTTVAESIGPDLDILNDEILALADADIRQRATCIDNEVKVMQQVGGVVSLIAFAASGETVPRVIKYRRKIQGEPRENQAEQTASVSGSECVRGATVNIHEFS